MRFSVCVDPGRPWPDILALAQGAETVGLDRVYVCDHFIPVAAAGGEATDFMFEAWTTIAALGACTDRIDIGTLVLCNTFRHPAVVANMAATLDRATNGRFVLGLGAGGQTNEHTAYGIDLPAPATRLDRLEEACQVIRLLLTEEISNFSGQSYRLRDARCDPKPMRRLPLMIGGGGERRTIRIAANFADEWHTWASPQEFRRKNAILDQHCADDGRDPASVLRSTGGVVRLSTNDNADVTPADDNAVIGTVDLIAEHLVDYQAAGANEFIIRDEHVLSVDQTLETLSRLSTDVLPSLR
jgi:F420-dependent oxidoreductase-like protein